jgi:hypothetical protein
MRDGPQSATRPDQKPGGYTLDNGRDAFYLRRISANIRRRHLTTEQKRDLLGKLIKANPAASDRSIGKVANVDNKTVAAVRKGMEATEEIPQLKTREGADGKKRTWKRKTRTEVEKAVTDFKRYRELMVGALDDFDNPVVQFPVAPDRMSSPAIHPEAGQRSA